jgi:hypothetical protein
MATRERAGGVGVVVDVAVGVAVEVVVGVAVGVEVGAVVGVVVDVEVGTVVGVAVGAEVGVRLGVELGVMVGVGTGGSGGFKGGQLLASSPTAKALIVWRNLRREMIFDRREELGPPRSFSLELILIARPL